MLVVGTKPSQHAAHQDLAGYGGHDPVLSIRIKVLMLLVDLRWRAHEQADR